MAKKLVDDCFRIDPRDGQRLSHDRTLELLRSRVTPVVASSSVPITQAVGRFAACSISASRAVPGHTNSAVDGFAFRHEHYDQESSPRIKVEGRAAAGRPMAAPAAPDTAARIFTGAVLPDNLDTVAMQEDCDFDETAATVTIPSGLKKNANVRRAGEDVGKGDRLIAQGHKLRPNDIAALASIGAGDVECYQMPRIAIVSTGDEVVRGTAPLKPGQVYDVNAPLLTTLSSLCDAKVSDLGVWPDQRDAVINGLAHAADSFDLVLTSGGASQGEEDHISHALEQIGSRHFWQIAVKPGRPLMFGQIGETIVVGLPGNPVAVFVCFLMYVYPLIRRLGGGNWFEPKRFPLPADFTFENRKVGRREFWRGTVQSTETGLVAQKFPRDGSGLISGLRQSNGLIDIPEDVPAVRPGDMVNFIPYSEFGIRD